MSSKISTKQKLLGLIDDVDLLSRELMDILGGKDPNLNPQNIIELLVEKDKQIKQTLKDVRYQVELQKKIDHLKNDINNCDQQISVVQHHLIKSELLLSTALYYSRQKLESMQTAASNPVDTEEVIRYGHKISASHGAVAPENWVIGDNRRPYPRDEEMQRGFLGHIDENGQFRASVVQALNAMVTSGQGSGPTSTPAIVPAGGAAASGNIPGVAAVGQTLSTPPLVQGAQAGARGQGRGAWGDFATIGHSQGSSMPPPNQPPGTFSASTLSTLLPPGVNVVSSPGMYRSSNAITGLATMIANQQPPPPPQYPSLGVVPGRTAAAVAMDDVEVMSTDSSSSSSSDE